MDLLATVTRLVRPRRPPSTFRPSSHWADPRDRIRDEAAKDLRREGMRVQIARAQEWK